MNPPPKLQPSRLLIISSILMIAVAVLMAGTLFSAVFSSDKSNIIFGLLFLPFPLSVIYLQYRGTFHRHPNAAGLAGVMSLSMGVLLLAIFAMGILMSMASLNWIEVLLVASFLGIPSLLAGAIFLFFARINFNWAKILVSYYAEKDTKPPTFRFSTRELMGAMALVSVIAGLGVSFSR